MNGGQRSGEAQCETTEPDQVHVPSSLLDLPRVTARKGDQSSQTVLRLPNGFLMCSLCDSTKAITK